MFRTISAQFGRKSDRRASRKLRPNLESIEDRRTPGSFATALPMAALAHPTVLLQAPRKGAAPSASPTNAGPVLGSHLPSPTSFLPYQFTSLSSGVIGGVIGKDPYYSSFTAVGSNPGRGTSGTLIYTTQNHGNYNLYTYTFITRSPWGNKATSLISALRYFDSGSPASYARDFDYI
jgi:hypothetical protein